MDYQVIDQFRPEDTVKVLGVESDWVKVTVTELTGYVHKNYLNIHTEAASGSETFELTEDNMQSFLQMFGQGFGSTPLTSDGNLTLVDDFGSITGTEKQFVTLVTQAGNYFYLIINRDEKGNENVHFLNQVDEADLFALMDEDEAAAMKEQIAAEGAAKAAAEAAEKVKTEQTEPQPTEPAEQEPKQKPSKLPYAIGLILLIGACGAGGAFFYLKNRRARQNLQNARILMRIIERMMTDTISRRNLKNMKRKTSMMRTNKKMSEQNRNYEQSEEITLHFGKGTVEPFTAKDGREMMKIVIHNEDRSDHTPWASFVLPVKAVHENQYGKGLWAKIPADGHTTLTKPYLAGQSEEGKNI